VGRVKDVDLDREKNVSLPETMLENTEVFREACGQV
jgi:hypothetical protein